MKCFTNACCVKAPLVSTTSLHTTGSALLALGVVEAVDACCIHHFFTYNMKCFTSACCSGSSRRVKKKRLKLLRRSSDTERLSLDIIRSGHVIDTDHIDGIELQRYTSSVLFKDTSASEACLDAVQNAEAKVRFARARSRSA